MLLAFSSSSAMLISVIATFLTGLFVIVTNQQIGIPVHIGIALIILSFLGLSMLLSLVGKLYSETLKRCNDDIDGFVKEQKRIAKKTFGKTSLNVRMNLIFGLIAHEHYTEAESILMLIAPKIEKKSISKKKLDYLMYNLYIYKNRHDKESYFNIMQRLMSEIHDNLQLYPLERIEYEHLAEINKFEAVVFDNDTFDKTEPAKQLNFLARAYLSQEHSDNIWNEYMTMRLNYILGITYLIADDMQSAEFHLKMTASQPFTYPEVARAKNYLLSHNTDILFS